MSENELSSKAQVQEEIQTDDYFYLFQNFAPNIPNKYLYDF